MNTLTILAAGAVGTGALAAIPLLVWPVAGRINTARDIRDHTVAVDRTNQTAEVLIAQIHDGVRIADDAGDDPDKIAAAAFSATGRIRDHLHDERNPGIELVELLVARVGMLPGAHNRAESASEGSTPLTDAAALQLLLHRIRAHYGIPHPAGYTAVIANGILAEVLRATPAGRVLDFNPLTEHDPAWMHLTQAVWIQAAKDAGMGGWERALPAEGETTVAVTR